MTRDGAWTQYSGAAVTLGLPLNSELQNDFQGYWNSASRDSGAYQSGPNGTPFAGSIYDRSWADVWPEAYARLVARAGSTDARIADSQSTAGNALYGSATGNIANIPGATPVLTAYVPATVARTPLASVITTMGATESLQETPTVGPVGLAYPDDPINYSTMQRSPAFGYNGLQSGNYSALGASAPVAPAMGGAIAAPADNTMLYVILAGAALAAYVLFAK